MLSTMLLRITCYTFISSLLLGFFPGWGAEKTTSIFFYNPDANLKDISILKAKVGSYLRKMNTNMDFQPFIRFDVMEQQIEVKKPSFIIISSWYYHTLAQKHLLHPLLIPQKNGQKSYRKVLVTLESIQDLKELNGKTLATTPLGENTPGLLATNFFRNTSVDVASMKIITVPKDLDALLAVSYRRVNSAMVVPDNINALKAINPVVEKIKIVYTSPEILFPPLVALINYASPEEIKKIQLIFSTMPESLEGQQALDLLNYDGWTVLDKEALERLSQNL